MRRLEGIALTQEALVAAVPNRENRSSAAFVAATAHQLRYSAERLLVSDEAPSRLSIDAIAPEIASALMFLIAGRAADAAQMARNIRVGNPESIEGVLRQSVVDLAQGRLGSVLNRTWSAPAALEFGDDTATILLWSQLAIGIRAVAGQLLGNKRGIVSRIETGWSFRSRPGIVR
ncbi:MAG TPA: hypothetical protein VMT20_27230 [Terriglobia bacterium]|nr:hypothetical protein [Terriglobia bacterium]